MNAATAVRRIAILTFIGGLGGGLVFPILPALGLRLGIPAFMVGLILSANRIARLVFNVPAGHLIGRLGPRLTLCGALLVESLAIFSFSIGLRVGPAMWWLLAGRAVFGIGTAFLFVGSQAAVLSLSDKSDRGRKSAAVRVALSAAMPAGLVLGGVLADRFSDDVAFLAGAAIAFVGALYGAAFLPRVSPRSPAHKSVQPGLRALLVSENAPFIAAAWGFNLLIFLTMQGALLSTLVLLIDNRHIQLFGLRAQGTSGMVMAVLVACSAFISYGLGHAIDRARFRSTLLFPSLVGLAAGFAVMAFAHSLWLVLLGAVLVGLTYNGVTLPMMALLGDAVSERHYGPAVGIYQFFGDIGGTIGPIAGIEAATRIGLTPLYLAIAAMPALALSVAVWLHRHERRLHARQRA